MRIAICDDEEIFRRSVCEKINEIYKDDIDMVLRIFERGETLIKDFKENDSAYDIIFLDIEMENINGIDTARNIRKINTDVLIAFLTSHEEFAKDGYEVNAFRYLSKPIREDKLIECIENAKKICDGAKKIIIKYKDEEIILKATNIIYLEAQNKDIYIHTRDNVYVQKNNLSYYENQLKECGFFRVHRSFIVNFNYVKSYTNKEVLLDNNEKVNLSRLKYKSFKDQLY
ncbi:MAG: LytTR family DNA-binding domain-containing protein, partial [Clostridium sp.]|nr:LytTR family DNA-binding domain-containing protein [Clostridium sp.]